MENYLDRQARELAELQDEIAGRHEGKRQDRFLIGREPDQDQERRRKRRSTLTALEMLLLDPIYAQAYDRAWEALERAQERVDQALLEITARMDALRAMLADMEARAVKLPDGTPVFLDTENRWRTADGGHLSAEETALLVSSADSPKWEEFQNVWLALDGLQNRLQTLTGHAEQLDEGRNRLRDNGDPLSLEDLEGFADRVSDYGVATDAEQLKQAFAYHGQGEALGEKLDLSAYIPGARITNDPG